ncbi:tyrosine-protein kinase receptor-like isoform X2 [Centruroides vittatus]|uniref:tyrosine-protein kinase receptor-like isoform X2 n=1 Tax=Centruroides vittatus TaxID=120091 RepID=UPI00350F6328
MDVIIRECSMCNLTDTVSYENITRNCNDFNSCVFFVVTFPPYFNVSDIASNSVGRIFHPTGVEISVSCSKRRDNHTILFLPYLITVQCTFMPWIGYGQWHRSSPPSDQCFDVVKDPLFLCHRDVVLPVADPIKFVHTWMEEGKSKTIVAIALFESMEVASNFTDDVNNFTKVFLRYFIFDDCIACKNKLEELYCQTAEDTEELQDNCENCNKSYNGSTNNCNFEKITSYDCDFEIPCDWEWHSESGFGVATVANFSTPSTLRGDADNNPSGHFLYYPMGNGSVTDNITSPWFPNGSLSNCKLELWHHMYNMDEGIIKILVKSNDNITTEVGIISGNNHTTWGKHVQTIRSMSKPIHLVIEIVNPSEGIFPSHVAIDNIRFVHCLPKQLEVAECNSHYYLCPEDVCIYRHQVCDISKDCLNGEDEQEDCNQIPRSAFCDFETDTCKWTGNSTHENSNMSNWTRQSGPVSIRQERFGLYYDHTYKNESGHYMFPKYKSRYSFGTNNYLNSDIFHPPPIYHRTIQSSYYNTCQVRFFVYIHRRSSVTLVLNCVVLDPLYHNGRVIQLWDNKGHLVEKWEKIVLPIPAIKHSYYLQFVVTRSFNSNPIVAIDDVTLSPECFGIGIPNGVIDEINESVKTSTAKPEHKGYHFTTCGKNGTTGPTKQMCYEHYKGTNTEVGLRADRLPMAGIQEWIVPHTGVYTVTAKGAGGGRGLKNKYRSRGSLTRATFHWSKGEVIYILVGQQGVGPCMSTDNVCPRIRKKRAGLDGLKQAMKRLSNVDIGGGGGGGTFIFKKNPKNNNPMPLLIAGGGGGSSSDMRPNGGVDPNGRGYNSSLLAGNGMSSPKGAGGGGGWNDTNSETSAGQSLFQGGYGGNICSMLHSISESYGGFGGGGGPCASGGGGGGYRGGDAPTSDNPYTNGQGGTSFFMDSALFPYVEPGVNEGDGSVDILSAEPGCGCQYLCIILESDNSTHCICPEGQSLEKNGKSCKAFVPTTNLRDSHYISVQHVIMIVFSMVVAVVLIASSVYMGVTRYKKKQSRDMSHEPLNNAEVQLNRLRQVGGMVTEYNPNYEFGGSTCTIQDLPHVPRENLTLVKVLGQGAFGEVYRGYLTDRSSGTETPVAVKTLPELSSSQAEMDFLMEALILSKFNHPNIVRFLGVCFEKLPRFIVLELLPGGDLKTFLRESRPKPHKPSNLTMTDLLNVAMDVAKGCQYLEENHFIHSETKKFLIEMDKLFYTFTFLRILPLIRENVGKEFLDFII